ncbi:MAG: UvrD-helicase domain-containing protein [Alistipes sp.]|nr:UvrD-helicase domain-containing protein [Alistipes sp.]
MRAKILNASAGSGKTYQLAYKYVRDVVQQPTLYRHILAVTFTNKATEEMKSRILNEIHALASDAPSGYLANLCRELELDERTVRTRAREARTRILHDYSRFTILTIDTFFQRILRAFIQELGIDLNYNIEIETASVLGKGADALVEQIRTDAELQRWLTAFVEERIDEGKRWDVREGILSLGGEIFKESNRETLSTERPKAALSAIVERVRERVREEQRNFRELGAKAVGIMRQAGLSPADFTGKSRSFAHYFPTVADGAIKPPTATVRKMSLTTEGWCAKDSPARAVVGSLQPLLAELCSIYDTRIRFWNTAALLHENYRSFALLHDLYVKIRSMCNEENVMMLSETKNILSEFIRNNDAPFIYEKAGNRYDRFMIDEFQDTSAREWENFIPLLRNAMAQSEETSVLIVGDIKQSIYRWRGGDWRILHERAATELGKENTQTVHLTDNFRSLPLIVAFNNRTIRRVVAADNAALNAMLAEAPREVLSPAARTTLHDTLAEAYRSHEQTARKQSVNPGYINITCYTDEPPLIERIKTLIDKGFRPKDMMILVRSGSDGARAAAALLEFKRRNDDPRYRFDVMTQEALIVGAAPVSSFVIACLRLSVNPHNSLHRAIYNRFLEKEAFDTPLDEEEVLFFRTLRLYPPEEAFERIAMRYRLRLRHQELAYLQALHEQIIGFSIGRVADIPLFLRWWDEQGSSRSLSVEQGETTIEITTIHKAKGLEKKVVLIPYCNWPLDPKASGGGNIVWAECREEALAEIGRFPVRYKTSMGESFFSDDYYREKIYAHVDNINLLYVALTRAVESLHIFIPEGGGRGSSVGQLLLQNLGSPAESTSPAEPLEERISRIDNGGEIHEFGIFAGPEPEKKARSGTEHLLLEEYPTAEPDLRLRLPSQRYFERSAGETASLRDLGILLHKTFAEAASEEEIRRALHEMAQDGTISPEERERLETLVAEALADPLTGSWFDGSWQTVRNEQEIVLPGSGATRRPDRVMIAGNRAVVVDYKFGDLEAEKYRRQVREYMRLLREMGYEEVEGYLWYVRMGRTERVGE